MRLLDMVMLRLGWVRTGPTGEGARRWRVQHSTYHGEWTVVRDDLTWVHEFTEAAYRGPSAEIRAKAHAAALNDAEAEHWKEVPRGK